MDLYKKDPRYNVEYEQYVFSTLSTQINRYVRPSKR